MKGRPAEASGDQHRDERPDAWRQPDQRQHRHREKRPADEQDSRVGPVGDVPEAELRHRVRELEAHLQRARSGQREIQVGNEQRQQRREDVPVAVDE
jgi:hypothetical protein